MHPRIRSCIAIQENLKIDYLKQAASIMNRVKVNKIVSSRRWLIEVFSVHGNPFKEQCQDLLMLDTRNIKDKGVLHTVNTSSKELF